MAKRSHCLLIKNERIHIPHVVNVPCPENVVDADDVLMVEAQQDLDFPQCALAVRLMLKRADFLNGYALVCHVVHGRAEQGEHGKEQKTWLMLHNAQYTHTHTPIVVSETGLIMGSERVLQTSSNAMSHM